MFIVGDGFSIVPGLVGKSNRLYQFFSTACIRCGKSFKIMKMSFTAHNKREILFFIYENSPRFLSF